MSKTAKAMGTLASVAYQAKCQQYRIEFLLDFTQGSVKKDLQQLYTNQQNIINRILKGLPAHLREELATDLEREEIEALACIFDTLADQEDLLDREDEYLQKIKNFLF